MLRRVLMGLVVSTLGLTASRAWGSEEFITSYDAKAVGMGLTGTAWQNNASSQYINAANLGAIKRFDLVLALAPNLSRVRSPYLSLSSSDAQPTILQARSNMAITPLGFVGVGYRIHRVLAIGLAGGVSQVAGMRYGNVPLSIANPALALQGMTNSSVRNALQQKGEATALGLIWDARATVALNLAKWLSIGGGYRIAFSHQEQVFEANGTKLSRAYLNGQHYAGGFAGISLKPHRLVRIGLSYTSQMNMVAKGFRNAAQPVSLTVLGPAHANAGIAVQTANNRLTLAADFKYFFYKDAARGLDADTVASNRDAMSGNIGAEFYVSPRVPIRAGFVVGRSRTTDAGAFAVRFPPGMVYGGTLGTGVRLDRVDFDLGVGYGGAATNLSAGKGEAGIGGRYGLDVVLVQVSANVRI